MRLPHWVYEHDPRESKLEARGLSWQWGVDKAVILPLNNAETPAEHQSAGEVLGICDRYPGRFIPFCNIDPRALTNSADAPLDRVSTRVQLW